MRTLALILTVVVAALTAATAHSQDKDKTEEPAKKIKGLQKERIAALKELADVTTKMFESGRASPTEALDARLSLLQAELDASEKSSERVALYQKTVDALKEYEKGAEAQREAGRGTRVAVLKVRAKRLEVEVHLEQAKLQEAKGGK